MSVYSLLDRHNRGHVISAVKVHYPKFSKGILSECENGHKYGVDLLPYAKKILVDTVENLGCETAKRDRRKKPHRLCVRLSDSAFSQFEQHISLKGFSTVQGYLEQLIIEDIKKGAAAWQSDDAKAKRVITSSVYTNEEGKVNV